MQEIKQQVLYQYQESEITFSPRSNSGLIVNGALHNFVQGIVKQYGGWCLKTYTLHKVGERRWRLVSQLLFLKIGVKFIR